MNFINPDKDGVIIEHDGHRYLLMGGFTILPLSDDHEVRNITALPGHVITSYKGEGPETISLVVVGALEGATLEDAVTNFSATIMEGLPTWLASMHPPEEDKHDPELDAEHKAEEDSYRQKIDDNAEFKAVESKGSNVIAAIAKAAGLAVDQELPADVVSKLNKDDEYGNDAVAGFNHLASGGKGEMPAADDDLDDDVWRCKCGGRLVDPSDNLCPGCEDAAREETQAIINEEERDVDDDLDDEPLGERTCDVNDPDCESCS